MAPATVALPKTRIMTALVPVKLIVTPPATVSDWNARMSMLGPPLCVIVCGAGSVCEQVAPLHALPLNVTVPAHVRFTAAEALRPESCAEVRPAGVYPNDALLQDAGMPPAPSTQPKPSVAALVDVHDEPQERSFLPEMSAHWPLEHCALLVQ
jgi:hypothetical protein